MQIERRWVRWKEELGTHCGLLGPAWVGPPLWVRRAGPVSMARLLWLPERWLGGRGGPIFDDSTLPPARNHMNGSGLRLLGLEPRQGPSQPDKELI